MKESDWLCEECQNRKRLFFIKPGPAHIFITIGGLILWQVVRSVTFTNEFARIAAEYGTVMLAAAPFFSLLHIRCVTCEPEWLQKRWF